MIKYAKTEHPINDLFRKRWSPYKFSDRCVENEDLMALFEAARWAPSSYNEQPWRFILATKKDSKAFEKMLSVLVEANQAWAKNAWALVLATTQLTFARNGKANKAAQHDLGAAVSYLSLEAAARGISVHQMIGIDASKASNSYQIPSNVEVLTAFAIGYSDASDTSSDMYTERDNTARTRLPLDQILFRNKWIA